MGFLSFSKAPKKAPPALEIVKQNPAHKQNLCLAIRAHRIIQFTSDERPGLRFFAPHAVYCSTGGKLCMTGYEMTGPRALMKEAFFLTVELARLAQVSLTSYRFSPHPSFSTAGRKYEGGVICAVDR